MMAIVIAVMVTVGFHPNLKGKPLEYELPFICRSLVTTCMLEEALFNLTLFSLTTKYLVN